MALKDKIRDADDVVKKRIEVPGWNVTLEGRAISGMDRAKLFATGTDKDGEIIWEKFILLLIVMSYYDPETDERVFNESDIDWLKEKSADSIELLAETTMRLNGLLGDSVKVLEKNSDSVTLNVASTSA